MYINPCPADAYDGQEDEIPATFDAATVIEATNILLQSPKPLSFHANTRRLKLASTLSFVLQRLGR